MEIIEYKQMEVTPNEDDKLSIIFRKIEDGSWVGFPYVQGYQEEDDRLQYNMSNDYFTQEGMWSVMPDISFRDWENIFQEITNNIDNKPFTFKPYEE